GTGRPRSLTAAQERQVFRWVNGRDPRQYGLDFGLWTRAIVALLIEQKFGVDMGVTSVGSRRWPARLNAIARRFCFGMNPVFAPTPFMERLGVCAARLRLCTDPGNGSRSPPPRR